MRRLCTCVIIKRCHRLSMTYDVKNRGHHRNTAITCFTETSACLVMCDSQWRCADLEGGRGGGGGLDPHPGRKFKFIKFTNKGFEPLLENKIIPRIPPAKKISGSAHGYNSISQKLIRIILFKMTNFFIHSLFVKYFLPLHEGTSSKSDGSQRSAQRSARQCLTL